MQGTPPSAADHALFISRTFFEAGTNGTSPTGELREILSKFIHSFLLETQPPFPTNSHIVLRRYLNEFYADLEENGK